MYVKFRFTEMRVNVPGCWAGIFAVAKDEIVVLDNLPKDVSAGEFIFLSNDLPKIYDYYHDCGQAETREVLAALKHLLRFYGEKRPHSLFRERVPEQNEVISNFKDSLKMAMDPDYFHALTL